MSFQQFDPFTDRNASMDCQGANKERLTRVCMAENCVFMFIVRFFSGYAPFLRDIIRRELYNVDT